MTTTLPRGHIRFSLLLSQGISDQNSQLLQKNTTKKMSQQEKRTMNGSKKSETVSQMENKDEPVDTVSSESKDGKPIESNIEHIEAQLPADDYGEAKSYVENVMSQPLCASVTTPTTNRRKRYLSAPSADTTVKKRKNIINLDAETAESDSQNEDVDDADAESDVGSVNGTKGRDNNRRRFVKVRRDLKISCTSDPKETDTEKVLKAVMDLQLSIDKRFDEMHQENKSIIKQLQDQISDVRKEFNGRIDGLSKKVETKVTQNVKKGIDYKFISVRKDMDNELSKVRKQVKDAEKDIVKVKETIMPTMNECLGDELDELRNRVRQLEEVHRGNNANAEHEKEPSDALKDKNIIIRNFPERENEDVKHRVKNMIRDCLKQKNITVMSAERLVSRNSSAPSIVKVTLDSKESKQSVMKNKHRLKDSSRYRHAFIEHDIPATQRRINANFRTLLHALGDNNLHLRGSRISSRQERQDNQYSPQYRASFPPRQQNRDNYWDYRSETKNSYVNGRRDSTYEYDRSSGTRRSHRFNN